MDENKESNVEQLMVWSTAVQNDLPDSSFLYIADGGKKDSDGKTVPRSLRKLPYKDANGKVDLPHLRNAISRLAQSATDIPESVKKSLLAKARKILSENSKESHSAEEIKMTEDELNKVEEQLNASSASNTSEVKTEEKKESISETKVDEVKTEVKTEVVAEVKTEVTEVKAEVVPEVKIESPKESLSSEIKKTEEELQVVKEVRDELVVVYAKNKDLEVQKEQLSVKVKELETENVKMKEQLGRYVEAEKQIEAKKRTEKLSSLSAKFKLLGQEKTIEQLSTKDDATIDEFEKIVDAALEKTKEKEAPAVTVNSQSTVVSDKKEQLSSEKKVVAPKVIKKTSNDDFFKNICAKLTKEQMSANNGHKALYL